MSTNRICLHRSSVRLRTDRLVGLAVFGLLLMGIVGCSPKAASRQRAQDAVAVVTAIVKTRDYTLPIEAIGTARAFESVLVTSRVSGRVSKIYLTEGAMAKAGDPLVLLEDDAEHAELRSAAAAAAQASSHFERLRALAEKGLVSRYERDRQEQIVETSLAQLELAKVLLDQRTIRAPFSGSLGFRQISPGTLVQPGTGIVTLDARDKIRVAFSVAEALISNLNIGDLVEVGTAAYRGRLYLAKLETIGTRVDELTRAVPVQAIIDNNDGSLMPGMMLTLRIMSRSRQVTYVPESALAPENARQFVWRISTENTAERVPVNIGVRGPGWVEILAGVREGERIVLEGAGSLRPGRTVREVPQPGMTLAVSNGTE